MLRAALVLSALVAVTGAQTRAGTPPPPIIDVHVHAQVVPPRAAHAINCASPLQEFAPRDGHADFDINGVRSHCDEVLVAPASDTENRAAVLRYFEKYNVTGVLLGSSFADTAAWMKQFGERAIPAVGLMIPGSPSVEELRAAILAGKVRLLAEVAVQYQGIAPDAVSLEPYFALAEELDFPVGIHIGLGAPAAAYAGQPQYLASLTHPMLLEPVLRAHPHLRVFVMHAGWPMADEMVHLMYSHPQVYVDTGIIDWGIPRKEFYRHLQRLVDAGFANRILFGTDQMIWPDAIPRAIEAIQQAPFLTEAQRRDIFHNNAVRFLRLSGVGDGVRKPRTQP